MKKVNQRADLFNVSLTKYKNGSARIGKIKRTDINVLLNRV